MSANLKQGLTNVFLLILVFFIMGCVKMKEYTGTRQGYAIVGVQKKFGEGTETKSYYLTEEGIDINVDDKKEEIFSKLGAPQDITKNIDGYECWTYKDKKLKLYFNGEYLRSWETDAYAE